MLIPKRILPASSRAGFSMIEVMVAMPIVVLSMGMFVQMLTAGTAMREGGGDRWLASSAAQDTLEVMRNQEFSDLCRLYGEDPFDDPMGPGTAPGAHFEVPGLTPDPNDPDGFVGEVLLPMVNTGTAVAPKWELREDVANEDLGMPRDLTGDSVIQSTDCAADFSLLPVTVRLRWRSRFGPRVLTFTTILAELRG